MGQYLIITEEEINNHPNDFELGKLVRMKYIKSKEPQECPICGADKKCTPEKENCKKEL
jgi:hypothetical protein